LKGFSFDQDPTHTCRSLFSKHSLQGVLQPKAFERVIVVDLMLHQKIAVKMWFFVKLLIMGGFAYKMVLKGGFL
jgi:hypothetical protein